jgi:hypothetical protein
MFVALGGRRGVVVSSGGGEVLSGLGGSHSAAPRSGPDSGVEWKPGRGTLPDSQGHPSDTSPSTLICTSF